MTYFVSRTAIADVLADLTRVDACYECGQDARVEVRGDDAMAVTVLHEPHCAAFAEQA